MIKDKMIKVSSSTHYEAKAQASINGKSLREYIKNLIVRDKEGIILDVSKVKSSMLISVFDDICIEMNRREDNNKLTKEEIRDFTLSIENIPFIY